MRIVRVLGVQWIRESKVLVFVYTGGGGPVTFLEIL